MLYARCKGKHTKKVGKSEKALSHFYYLQIRNFLYLNWFRCFLPILCKHIFTLSVVNAVLFEVGDEHTRPIGLDEIETVACEPTPTKLRVATDGGIIGVSCGQLFFVVVNDGICPDESIIAVHTLTEGFCCDLVLFGTENYLCAEIVDITTEEFLVAIVCFNNDWNVGKFGCEVFQGVKDGFGRCRFDENLVDDVMAFQGVINLDGMIPEFI